MEQGQCWIQTKRKYSIMSPNNNNLAASSPTINPSLYGGDFQSWEEQAFAEDAAAAGSLGGCIWPPRSYSCSFCRREFRSAQALGGHMNVHRKDRARLKQQQPSSPNQNNHEMMNMINLPYQQGSDLGYNNNNNLLYPSSPVNCCELVYKKTNNNSDPPDFLSSKALLGGREETLIPFCNSSSSSSSILHKISSSSPACKFHPDDQVVVDIEKVVSNKGSMDSSSMSLNLVVCTKDEDMNNYCKKRKKDVSSSNLIFTKASSVDDRHDHHMQPKMFEVISPSFIDEVDLELRLGSRSN